MALLLWRRGSRASRLRTVPYAAAGLAGAAAMTHTQFISAVALGQITPGPVVPTVAAVGCAERGVGAGLLAALIAFAPSFLFVLLGGGRYQ